LARNIKKIKAETWEEINRILLGYAKAQKIEDGSRVRIDPTVTETNIHPPTDNKLLFDCVRVFDRLLGEARTFCRVSFSRRITRAKRRSLEIMNAPNRKRRLAPYQELLKVTREVMGYAKQAVISLKVENGPGAHRLAEELEGYILLAEQVISQTQRRVLHGESVPATEKLVSIFEPHTDIIRKDRRDTYYGHKLTLSGGESGLILDWVVESGNPADVTLMKRMLDRLKGIYGNYPEQVAVDGGFASEENLRVAKELGVVDIAFAKKRGLTVENMTSSKRVYRALRDFRAGIEGIISFLKRVFGLRRCTWRSLASFGSYVGASIVSANLLMLARHLM
jgi:transposase, IS5 family